MSEDSVATRMVINRCDANLILDVDRFKLGAAGLPGLETWRFSKDANMSNEQPHPVASPGEVRGPLVQRIRFRRLGDTLGT